MSAKKALYSRDFFAFLQVRSIFVFDRFGFDLVMVEMYDHKPKHFELCVNIKEY